MDKNERRAAVAAYKQRKPAHGVYAVICTATGAAWVGHSGHVDKIWNRLSFALRLGTSPYASLQAAWKQHGEREFRFEELERLRDDFPEYARLDELKTRQALSRTRLSASSL